MSDNLLITFGVEEQEGRKICDVLEFFRAFRVLAVTWSVELCRKPVCLGAWCSSRRSSMVSVSTPRPLGEKRALDVEHDEDDLDKRPPKGRGKGREEGTKRKQEGGNLSASAGKEERLCTGRKCLRP